MQINYLEDRKVDAALDAELRDLLSSCFTGEVNEVFRHQRFYTEMPTHRWLARNEEDRLVAHAALHDKIIGTSSGDLRVGGIAEVCVFQQYRGQGLVRRLLTQSHDWMIGQGILIGTLFGDVRVYGSSGYRSVGNPLRHFIPKTGDWMLESMTSFLVKPLGSIPWPKGTIDLRGPKF